MLASQQTFLPTDTTADPSFLLSNMVWIALVYLVVSIIITVFILRGMGRMADAKGVQGLGFGDRSMRGATIFYFGWVAVVLAVALSLSISILNDDAEYRDAKVEVEETNYQNMIQNIKSVYDVEEVRSLLNYPIIPADESKLLVFRDGVAYEVLYGEDDETYEPNLVLVATPGMEMIELPKK